MNFVRDEVKPHTTKEALINLHDFNNNKLSAQLGLIISGNV